MASVVAAMVVVGGGGVGRCIRFGCNIMLCGDCMTGAPVCCIMPPLRGSHHPVVEGALGRLVREHLLWLLHHHLLHLRHLLRHLWHHGMGHLTLHHHLGHHTRLAHRHRHHSRLRHHGWRPLLLLLRHHHAAKTAPTLGRLGLWGKHVGLGLERCRWRGAVECGLHSALVLRKGILRSDRGRRAEVGEPALARVAPKGVESRGGGRGRGRRLRLRHRGSHGVQTAQQVHAGAGRGRRWRRGRSTRTRGREVGPDLPALDRSGRWRCRRGGLLRCRFGHGVVREGGGDL